MTAAESATATGSALSAGSVPIATPRTRTVAAFAARARDLAPGLAAASVAATVAGAAGRMTAAVSPLAFCLLLGLIVGHIPALSAPSDPGLRLARGVLLKVGVSLLGFRLAIGSVAAVGSGPLAAVAIVAATTFTGVRWLARRLGLSDGLGALVGAGFAICGASAVVAAATVVDAEEEEVTFAAGLAMVFGTISLLALPLLATALGLSPEQLGVWSGASVNDVGQAVGAAAAGGSVALEMGVVTKLTRVLLLAPLLLLLRAGARRREEATAAARRQPILPWFVAAFLVAAVLRSTGLLPAAVIGAASTGEGWLLGLGLVGVGAAVDLRAVYRAGVRPLVLGACAWALVVSAGLAAAVVAAPG